MGYWADLQKSVKEKDKREGVRRSDYINRDVVKKAAVTGAQESDQAKNANWRASSAALKAVDDFDVPKLYQIAEARVNAAGYDASQSYLRAQRSQARKDRFATAVKQFASLGTDEYSSAKAEHQQADSRYDAVNEKLKALKEAEKEAKKKGQDTGENKDAKHLFKSVLKDQKKNEWEYSQESNLKLLNSNADVAAVVAAAAKAKSNAETAQSNIDNTQALAMQPGNTSAFQGLQQYQKDYQTAYNDYQAAVKQLQSNGYDAESLIDTYSRKRNEIETQKLSEQMADFSDKHPVASSAAYVALNSAQTSVLPQIAKEGLSSAITGKYKPLDTNTGAFGATNLRDAIADKNSENIQNKVLDKTNSEFASKAASFLYQTGLSIGDFGSLAALPEPLSLAIMSSGAAASTAKDATQRGLSADKAMYTATAAAIAESFFEKFSLENLKAMKASGKTGFVNQLIDVAKQSFTEGSEEFFNDLANAASDFIINGRDAGLAQQYQYLVNKKGFSKKEAAKKVAANFGMQIGESFLGGAISGGALGGAVSTMNSIEGAKIQHEYSQYGKDLRRSGNAGELIDAGLTADKNSKLYRIAAELADAEDSGKTISKRQLGKLAMEMQTSDDAATTQAQKTVLEDAVRQRLQDSGVKNVDKAASRFVSSYFDGEGKIKGDKATKALYAELQDNSTDWAQSTTRSMAYEMLRGGSSAAYMNELLVNPKAKGYNEFKDTYGGITEAKIAQLEQERLEQEPAEQRETEHGSADASYNALVTEVATPVDLQRAEPVPESQVKGVLKVQDGHTVVELQDGTKTTTDYVQFNNPNTKAVYKSAAKFGSLGAYALVNNYDSKVNPYSYLHAAESFYNAGASGKITFDQAANTLSAPIEMGIMDRGAANELFLSGQEQSKEIGTTKTAVTKANKNQGGVVTLTGEATVTPQEKEVLDRVAAKTKLDIVLDGSLESNDNGYIDPANGKVVLNPDSGHIYATLMHELGEYTHAYNTAEMMDACRPIVEYMLATGDYAHDDKIDLLQKYVDGYSENGKQYSIEDAVSEMIFDFISGEASTQEGGEKFAKWLAEDADLTQKEKKSVIEKIKDFFAKLLDAVRSVIEGQGTLNTTARAGQKAAQQVPVLDDFFNALDNAIDNRQRMLDGEQNSTESSSIETIRLSKKIDTPLSEVTNDVLSMADEKAKQNAAEDTYIRIIKNTPQVILEHVNGSEDLEVIMRFDKYYLAARRDGVLDGHYHNLGTLMSELPRYIEQPDAIIRLENGRLNVISDLGGKNGLISIELSTVKDINSKYQKYNLVVTAFEPKTNYLKNTIKKAVKVHYEKKDLSQVNHQLYEWLAIINDKSSNTKVSQNGSGVNTHSMQKGQKNAQNGKKNTRHSLEVDSQGNELTEAQQRRYKHVAPELRDEDGKIKPFYHGTARADRVGYVFDPKRATSGPMAYFTDDPDIATNYSRDKADTSLAYDSDYDSYETQFQVNGKPVTEYWNTLTAAEKKAMTEKIKQVTLDDNNNIVLKPGNQIGIGSFSDYELHRAKGNALSVLVDMWLGDGNLWNEESRFLDVLKAVGIDQAQYNDPDYREEKVYQAYLNITNPYNTGKLDQSFIDDLQSYVDDADMSRYDTDNAQADMWDKNGIPIEDWLERLQDDLDNGTTHAWTTVPDVVTDFLKDSGYDGIVDQGGKNGGDQHTVAIPFYSNQIKEVTNGNPTDSPDIRYSKRVGFDNALTGAEKKKYNRALQTGEDAGLRISDNSILVECENNSKYQYKYVVYDDMEDGPVIRDVYAIGRIDPNVEDDVASQCHNIARYINDVKELHYDNQQVYESILRSRVEGTAYLLAGYNNRSKRFHVIGRGSVENGTNTLNKSVRERTAGQDTRAAGGLTESRKSKSIDDTGRTSLLRDDKRLDEMNITLRQVFDSQELETGHHTSQTQVQRVARQLKKSTGSKMDTPRLMVQLKGLFDYIGNNDDVTFSSVMDQAKEIAHELLDSTPEHTVRDEYAQEVLDTLRGMAITLSDEQKAETAYHHDRYGNDLLFLYFASKSTAISAVTPKAFCFLLLFV